MNFRLILTLYLLLYMAVCSTAFAQVVNVPDPALERLIRQKLRIRSDRAITQDDMLNLRGDFDAGGNIGITDITGLEYAKNLTALSFYHNPISDISPMSGMTGLTGFNLWGCQIENLTPLRHLPKLTGGILGNNRISNLEPLSGLTNITFLNMDHNRISDVKPLSTLHNLVRLELNGNQIADYSPLANLTSLQVLWIQNNLGDDFSPLSALNLTDFRYDEVCDVAPLFPSVTDRIKGRSLPSIFQAWDGVVGLDHLSEDERNELHDLHFSQSFGLTRDRTETTPTYGLATSYAGDLEQARENRERKIRANPNMVFLIEVRLHNHFVPEAFPHGSEYWLRDTNGNIARNSDNQYLIDFLNPNVQQLLIQRILAIEQCGLFDGVMIDGFFANATGFIGRHLHSASDDDIIRATTNILRTVRANVRDEFLILVNANQTKAIQYKEYVNGSFMETLVPGKVDPFGDFGLIAIEDTLLWSENNFREPQINCLEGWGFPDQPPDSALNRKWMRVFTTLGLTHSDGYTMFNTGNNHVHTWYDFWDVDLGQPVGPKAQLYENTEGVFIREFTNGWAVYNRSGKAHEITLPEEAISVTSGFTNTLHALPDLDGEIYLRAKPPNPADVNEDGAVNILDLTLVAQGLGTGDLAADVNGDGVVNVFDLVFVANQF